MNKLRILIIAALLSVLTADAQTVTNVIEAFNTNSYLNGTITNKWSNWFGGAFQSLSFDPTSDANGNPQSGSLKIVSNFPTNTDQFEVWNGINGFSPAINGFQFTNFQCDVRFAAGSATNSSGYFGSLQFGVPTPTYGQDYFSTSVNVPASNTNWIHVSINLNPNTDTNLQSMIGLMIHIWGAGIKGPCTLWVDNLQFVGNASTGTATINYTNTAQRIDGFGASSAWYFSALTTLDADLLFSTNTGMGLSFLRTRIAPGGVIDDAEGTIAQEATARGARVWSTPWTPPVALKITNSWGTNAPLNGGWFSNTVANCQTYAADLASYVGIMKNTYGVNLYAVSIQNEPTEFVNYESCEWTSQAIHDFVPYLNASLIASNFAATKIMLPEHDGWSWDLATNTMNDTVTSNLVGILACHNYGYAPYPVTQFGTPCPKPVWETEHYLGTDDSITNGLQLAQEIHTFMAVVQANAYHYWWLKGSGTGSIANNTANPAKRLFVMGNYSKFVRPNFYRIGLSNTAMALVSAYADPASSNFVIVAANNSSFSVNQTFVLTNFPVVGPLRQWVTSGTESLANHSGAITATNGTFAMTLAPWTVTSFVYQQPVTNPPAILQQPLSQSTYQGGTISFSVQASGGTIPLYYQWLLNGTNVITGATNASLNLTVVAATNAGNYSVIVTNYAGSVTSSVASLVLNNLVWNTPVTISGTNDISTNGTLLYAYNNSGSSAAVNGVTFTGVNSFTTWGTGVTLGSGWSATSTSSYSGGSSAPWSNLPPGYQTVLQGGAWNNGGAATVTLTNLVVSRQYQVQVWVNDSRSGGTTNRTETLTDAYGNTVTLAYNSTYAAGGVGQYALGNFTATATSQSFTMNGAASTQLNALQVRDVTPVPVNVTIAPDTTNIFYGNSVLLTANATGTAPLSFKWYDNNTNAIAWGTNATLILTNPTVAASGNYTIVVTNAISLATNSAAVTINKATLTVTANSTNRPAGATNPVFTASYTGWTNADTLLSALTGSPAWNTTATTSSPVGSYAIVITNGTLSATNYTFVFVNGILSVTPAQYPTNLTFTANGGTLTLNWPATHLGWTLQVQTNAPGAGLGTNWTDIANSATTNQMDTLINPANGSAFYRLRQ